MNAIPSRLRRFVIGALALGCLSSVRGIDPRTELAASVVNRSDPQAGAQPQIVRTALTAAELEQPLALVVSLRMRNFATLEARLQAGGTIPRAEMAADYLPLQSDYDRLSAWLADQGFAPTLVDANHTNVFVRGSVAKVAAAFGVSFARVATARGEFTSAVSAPFLPSEFAAAVLAINGLQPEQQLEPAAHATPQTSFSHPNRAIPADILAAYHAPATLDGSGQVIAIVGADIPLASDLAAFYQAAGLAKTPADLVVVTVDGGPTATDTSNEISMDTEWSSALAPGAQVMLYATPTWSITELLTACVQIMNDGRAKIVSHSASGIETQYAPAALQSNSQVFAQMAAAGITVLHGSGDSGSTGVPVYPPSDPFVTALGGTTLAFDANWASTGETVWPQTGGGISTVFARPAWQTGLGVPAGTMRCVPDAASLSTTSTVTGTTATLVIRDGRSLGVGGDSLTGPVWAGLVALINQARAEVGLPTVGYLNPRLYPLLGTSCFHDITSGSNGFGTAGPGYDVCSGVGSPNVAALVTALTTSDPPNFSAQPGAQTAANGSTVVFRTSATGRPLPTYQWFKDGAPVAGATSAMLVLQASGATAGNYTCSATNALGTASSQAAGLALATGATGGHLINLSVLTGVTAQASTLTVGMVVDGEAGTTKPLLVRAGGPSLTLFGVTNFLPDPLLSFYAGATLLATNDNWGGTAPLADAFTKTGAFGYVSPTSKDAAIYLGGLAPGLYSMQITDAGGGTGTTIAEVYDADLSTLASVHLINLSVLKNLGGNETLTAGFVINGDAAETVLVRAIGPRLGQAPFNISGVMPDPQLALFNATSTQIAANDDWGGDPQLGAVVDRVGAFPVTDPASKDAMLLITLPPGNYSAQASDRSQAGGTVIVEVYEVR